MTDVMLSLVRAVRLCLRTPWTTLAIVVTIALGTGLNAAAIAVTYGILVRPLPYADASRLVVFDRAVKPGEIAEWRHRMSAVEDVAGVAGGEYAMRGPGPTRIVRVAFVTDGFFDILQPPFLAGTAPSGLARANGVVVSERLVRQAGLTPAQAIGRAVTVVDRALNMALVPATPGFIEAVGIPVVRGRSLREEDATGSAPTVLVSRAVARHLFGDRDAVGLTLPTATPGTRGQKPRVVGVVEDARLSGLVQPPGGALYVPWNHLPLAVVHLAVRTDGDPMVLAPSIRRVIQEVDPTVATGEARSLDALIVSSVAERRFYATVAAGFGLLALSVALVGLAATLGRLVAIRRHEFAVRMALGATPREAAGLLVRHAAVIVLAGLGAGTVLAVFASRGLSAYLYGVSASDAGTYVMVLAGTALAAALACGLPAWRVTSIEPGARLRSE